MGGRLVPVLTVALAAASGTLERPEGLGVGRRRPSVRRRHLRRAPHQPAGGDRLERLYAVAADGAPRRTPGGAADGAAVGRDSRTALLRGQLDMIERRDRPRPCPPPHALLPLVLGIRLTRLSLASMARSRPKSGSSAWNRSSTRAMQEVLMLDGLELKLLLRIRGTSACPDDGNRRLRHLGFTS